MATRSTVTKLIGLIPKDTLRPHANFGATLTSRIDEFNTNDVQALQNLTSDKYRQEYPLSDKLMRPAFNPEYYTRLSQAMSGDQKSKSPFHFITKYFRWQ